MLNKADDESLGGRCFAKHRFLSAGFARVEAGAIVAQLHPVSFLSSGSVKAAKFERIRGKLAMAALPSFLSNFLNGDRGILVGRRKLYCARLFLNQTRGCLCCFGVVELLDIIKIRMYSMSCAPGRGGP